MSLRRQIALLATAVTLAILGGACRIRSQATPSMDDIDKNSAIPSPAQKTEDDLALNFRAASDYSARFGDMAVLVMQNGEILFEEYREGYNENSASHIQSATKAFWSVAVAAMIEDGRLSGFDEKVSGTITEWQDDPDRRKRLITIQHLMELNSGLRQDVEYIQGSNPRADDVYAYVVEELEAATYPGRRFQYGPSHYYALGVVMDRKLPAQDPLDYLEERIFKPIGLEYSDWIHDPAGNPHIPNGAYLTPREWAKFGQLLLNKGEWKGEQIVRKDLMEALLEPSSLNPGHGKMLWLNNPGGHGAFVFQSPPSGSEAGFIYHDGFPDLVGALGAGKNRMYIVPSLDLVIVRQTRSDPGDRFNDHTFLDLLFSDVE